MTTKTSPRATPAQRPAPAARLAAVACTVSLVALLAAACKHGEPGTQVAGWAIADPAQRHPILVSEQPSKISIKVARGAHGLSPHQRSQLVTFLEKYRSLDAGNSKLKVSPPTGSANEVASMQAVAEIRYLMRESGFADASIELAPYHEDGDPQPPIRISYTQYVAEGPECKRWTTNVADDPRNLPYPNFGCTTQKNFAAMVANPADLVGPRQSTPAPGERRDTYWQKWTKGESTVSTKSGTETVSTKGN